MFNDLAGFVRRNSRFLHLVIATVVLLVFYHFRWGLAIFNPTYVNWVIDNEELSNGFFSFAYFRHEPWGFPIGKIDSYFYPIGTNVYTSDIPLLALFFKPIAFLLPEPFQYIGIWYLICHLLQAWFAILLCERLQIKGLSRAFAVIFLLFTPVLMSRYIHPSLFCQWMILAGLWIYFIDPEKTSVKRILRYQFCLFLISGLEFAYMWAMVFGFSVALFLRLWLIDKRIKFPYAIAVFSSHLITMILLWLLIGLFSFDGVPNYQMEGWGAFTLNLNSLYNPMGTASLVPTFPYSWAQHLEGYAYLGGGMLLLMAICIPLGVREIRLQRHQQREHSRWTIEKTNVLPLLLFLGFSLLYSLSNHISLNNRIIFEYGIGHAFDGLLNSFRSGGRFFWPLYYCIFISLFYFINKANLNRILKNLILGTCLLVQAYDIQSYLKPVAIKYEAYKPPVNLAWEKLIASFENVYFYPGYRRTYLTFDDYRYFTYYAATYHKKINIGYPARFDQGQVSGEIGALGNRIAEAGLDEGSLYVSLEPYLNSLALPIYYGQTHCFSVDGYFVFFKKTSRNEALAEYLVSRVGPDKSEELARRLMLRPWRDTLGVTTTTDAKMSLYEFNQTENHFFMKGWAFQNYTTETGSDSLYLIIESDLKQRWIAPTFAFGTEDVANYFNNPNLDMSGFGISLISKNLKAGGYRTGILFVNRKTQAKSLGWLGQRLNINRGANVTLTQESFQTTQNVRYDINNVDDDSATILIESWAFLGNGPCSTCATYFTLVSPSFSYTMEATTVPRPDVAEFFNDPGLVLSGHNVKFKKSAVQRGQYKIGVLIRDTLHAVNYYAETEKVIGIGMGEFEIPTLLRSTPVGKDSIRAFIDRVQDNSDSFEVEGWAYIHALNSAFTNTRLVLRSAKQSYQLEINTVERPDLKDYFHLSFNTDQAGFRTKFKKEGLAPGKYQVCVLLVNIKTNVQTLSCFDLFVEL